MADTVKLTIDGLEVEVPEGSTVLQAAEQAGVEIPVFCFHQRLKVAGNCRMCLVEMQGSPKPIASCAMPAGDNMVIHTTTPMVKKARAGVLEFLLINHPLDCPICDQGGECDLQDITTAYGADRSRFGLNKRAVSNKNIGPLIKTIMNRCIHCTRCVRFSTDVAGVPEMGVMHRGEHAEITTYLEQALTSEMSGNMIDICPVGALTSKPYAFKGRPWELIKTESVDVMDAVGSNIRVDSYGSQGVMRILPRLNEDINEEWISDKTRFACDALRYQRLDRPYARVNGKLTEVSWAEALQSAADKLKSTTSSQIAALAGDMADVESMFALKQLMDMLGSPHYDCRQDHAKLDASVRESYLFNTTIAGIDQADACLMVGGHVRYDAPVINARLRKRYLEGNFTAWRIGGGYPLKQEPTFPIHELGASVQILEEILAGKHDVSKALKKAKNPMIIVSMEALKRKDGEAISALCREIADKFGFVTESRNGFNVLHTAAARVGGLDMGFVPQKGGMGTSDILKGCSEGKVKVLYLLGADEIDLSDKGDTFVIYQGHHGDKGAHLADIIFPGAAYTEKDGTYVNTEGRVQRGYRATNPAGEAKDDWKIIRMLSGIMEKTLPYESLDELRDHLKTASPTFAETGKIHGKQWRQFGKKGALLKQDFQDYEKNHYQSDAIGRHSKTMAECADVLRAYKKTAPRSAQKTKRKKNDPA